MDRALAYLASQQAADGRFPSISVAQPAITSLGVLAFLSRGHQPGVGPYGDALERAVNFVLSHQRKDGLLSFHEPENHFVEKGASHTAMYNHAISGLMLSEVYGVAAGEQAARIHPAIVKALEFTRAMQTQTKRVALDHGAWRYYARLNHHTPIDSDLSVTSWQLMFYRSARNAEFDAPKSHTDEALAFVKRCFQPDKGTFHYGLHGLHGPTPSRGLAGCGILSLSLGGRHQTPEARAAGDWILERPFDRFGQLHGFRDRFFYAAFYCSQGMFQLGGKYWKEFYPPLTRTLIASQEADGSWPLEPWSNDHRFGDNYTTALAVLALTPPYQLIPIFQR